MQIQAWDSFCLSSTWLLEPKWGQIWVQKQWAGCFTVDRVEAGGSVLSPPQYRGGLTGLTGPRTHLLSLKPTQSRQESRRESGGCQQRRGKCRVAKHRRQQRPLSHFLDRETLINLIQGSFWTATATTAVLGGSYQMVHLRQQQQLLNHILRQERSKVKCSHSEYLLPFSQSLASHGCVVTLAVWYFYTGASTSDLCRNWHLLTTRKSSYFFSKTNMWLSSEVCTINIVCYLGAYYCTSSLLYQLVQGRWVGDSLVQGSEFKHLFWSFYVWVSDDSRFFWINLFCRDGKSKTFGLLVKWSAPNELASILQNPFARRRYNFCGTKGSIKIHSCWQWIVDDPIYLLGMKKK